MARKELLAVTIMVLICFSCIISIPIVLISVGFSPYNSIEYQETWEEKFDSSATVDLNLNIDVADVIIEYTYDPEDYHVKVDLDIDMIGQNNIGNNYSDYFNIKLDTTNTSLTFTMTLLPESEFDEVIWRKTYINVIITLNAVILFNINTTTNNEGDVLLLVSGGIDVNNIDIYTKFGNILFDFDYCTIGGNINGIVDIGNIGLDVNNVQYTKNSVWNLAINTGGINDNGDIFIDIRHITAINANITGTVYTNQGLITTHYTDNTPLVGVNFTFYGRHPEGSIEDFKAYVPFYAPEPWAAGYYYYSHEYPAIGNYDLSFYINSINDYGRYDVNFKNNITIL